MILWLSSRFSLREWWWCTNTLQQSPYFYFSFGFSLTYTSSGFQVKDKLKGLQRAMIFRDPLIWCKLFLGCCLPSPVHSDALIVPGSAVVSQPFSHSSNMRLSPHNLCRNNWLLTLYLYVCIGLFEIAGHGSYSTSEARRSHRRGWGQDGEHYPGRLGMALA